MTDAQTSTLLGLVSDISLNGFDHASLPSSKFVGDNSARDELAINLTTVATVVCSWVEMAKNTLSTGDYIYIWPGWTPSTVLGYLEAFSLDVNYTARQFMDRDTITVCPVQQIVSLKKAAHHLCCTLAGLHHLPRPAAITFVPHSFIGENHPRKDIPPLVSYNV